VDPPIPPLREALAFLTVEALHKLARRFSSRPPIRKEEVLDYLCNALQSRELVAAQLAQADRLTLLALAEAVYSTGRLDQSRFYARYGEAFTFPSRSGWDLSSHLRGAGSATIADLFFFGYRPTIPHELRPVLRDLLPAPEPPSVDAFEDLADAEAARLAEYNEEYRSELRPATQALTEASALHDLAATLLLVDTGKLPVSEATSQPSAAAVRALRERYLLPEHQAEQDSFPPTDAIRTFGFAMILQTAGLAERRGGRLELTDAGSAALSDQTPALLKRCWEAWVGANQLDELSRIRGLKRQKARGHHYTAPSSRKQAISRALAAVPPGAWITTTDFLDFVHVAHDFDVDMSDFSSLSVGWTDDSDAVAYLGSNAWDAVSGAYLRVILLEYAATLGLIDLALVPLEEAELDFESDYGLSAAEYSRYGGLVHFRVNALGRFILGQDQTYSGPAVLANQPVLKVLPSLDVVVAAREQVQPNDRAMLDRFLVRVSEDVYHLTKERLLQVAESGTNPRDVAEFLRRRAGPDLPQTATVFFSDVVRAATSVRTVGPAVLLECGDAHVAAVISHDSALKSLCLLAGERHLVVSEPNLAKFRRAIRRLGYVLPERELAITARRIAGDTH
jgi:hypothetical protein